MVARPLLIGVALLIAAAFNISTSARQPMPAFGGAYARLDERRQQLIDEWVARFTKTTGRSIQPAAFYDDVVNLSTKTTFDAVTHALLTTPLTDNAGRGLGDALGLIDALEAVRGEIAGARGDRQFRIYVRLKPEALDTLARSQQFERGADNSVYHKGYPINYRGQGGVPSIQISAAVDGRRADIDVDYRASSFPAALLNGHLTSANSDVRAGDNYDRHLNRWTGFQNWWRSIFGVRQSGAAPAGAAADRPRLGTPRAGNQRIDVMVKDFFHAWLVDGDVVAAAGYVGERAYSCLAQERENPAEFDRGMAPFELMRSLKAAHEILGKRSTLEGLLVGTRLTRDGLRVVNQPHHSQFVLYAVPDDIAAAFVCENRLTHGDRASIKRAYGNYFGASFYVDGSRDTPVALLWGKEDGYWKIVSWTTAAIDDDTMPAPAPVAEPRIERINADPSFARAVRDFFGSWLVRKDYDAAFKYFSSKSYACGPPLRPALEAAGNAVGPRRNLQSVIESADPFHPAIRLMNHQDSRVFSLSSIPDALADAADCAARAAGSNIPDPLPLEYGSAFGATARFKTRAGDAPVLRMLWRNEAGAWRITAYGVELP